MKTKLTPFKRRIAFTGVLSFLLIFFSSGLNAQTIITIGTGTVTNGTTGYPSAYGQYYTGDKCQYLILASELQSAGASAGLISSLAFDIVTASPATSSSSNLQGFNIKIGTTTATSLSSSWQTGLTSAFSTTSYVSTTGWNTHSFSTPFFWDGTSNIVIETCFDNYVSGADYSSNAVCNQSSTSFVSTRDYHSDGGGVCASSSLSSTYSQRPNMKLGITIATPPQTDLGILSWDYPYSSCGMSSSESIMIKVKNFGTVSQNSYTLKYSINGGTSWVSQAMTTAILPDSVLTFTFTTPANFATTGTYNCLAAVILPLDSNTTNDTLNKTVISTAGLATPYFQDFESFSTGLMTSGSWTSSTSTNPRWEIDVSNTSSSNTGPGVDHTLGTTAGKYAFMETSSPSSTGNISYLTSPCANFGNAGAVVMKFWYHMYGSTMGTLEVEQKVGGTWVTTGWSKTGQQHTSMTDPWTEAVISINPAADGIRFKGIAGSSYYSDMAIDDITIFIPMPNDLKMLDWVAPLAGTAPSATMPISVDVFNAIWPVQVIITV